MHWDLNAIHIRSPSETLVHRVIGNRLRTRLCLDRINRHVVIADQFQRLECIFGLEIEKLNPRLDIYQPKAVDIIYDQAIA